MTFFVPRAAGLVAALVDAAVSCVVAAEPSIAGALPVVLVEVAGTAACVTCVAADRGSSALASG